MSQPIDVEKEAEDFVGNFFKPSNTSFQKMVDFMVDLVKRAEEAARDEAHRRGYIFGQFEGREDALNRRKDA